MNRDQLSLVFLVGLAVAVLGYWKTVHRRHGRLLDQLDVRVHVNGIRGKSTVTRLVAGALREGGLVTLAKTTGSAARVIDPTGGETPLLRRGSATINEQVDVVAAHVLTDVEAMVIECMAVKPTYQEFSQRAIVRSDITVITNVREDHQEEMGETLEEIADSLSLTIPHGGVLVTGETRPALRARLERNAIARGSRFLYADPDQVDDEDMARFDHLQYKENVAVVLEVCRELQIPREIALEGMWRARPDVGVIHLRRLRLGRTPTLWVPMFAANDRESVLVTLEQLRHELAADAVVVAILNNRRDRGRRAELFADMAARDLRPYVDHVVTFGAYESVVTARMLAGGLPQSHVTNLGDETSPSLDCILDTLRDLAGDQPLVLLGMANIHTHQAEMLMEHFDRVAWDRPSTHSDYWHAPAPLRRLVRASTHGARTPIGGA